MLACYEFKSSTATTGDIFRLKGAVRGTLTLELRLLREVLYSLLLLTALKMGRTVSPPDVLFLIAEHTTVLFFTAEMLRALRTFSLAPFLFITTAVFS